MSVLIALLTSSSFNMLKSIKNKIRQYLLPGIICLTLGFSFLPSITFAGELDAPALNTFFTENGELYDTLKNGEGNQRILKDYSLISSNDTKNTQAGALEVRNIIMKLIDILKVAMFPIAVALLIFGGMMLFINRNNEDEFKKRVSQLIWTGIGFLLIFLSVNIVDFFLFGNNGNLVLNDETSIENASRAIYIEIFGIYKFITSFAIAIAVAYVVYAGIKLIISSESEDARGQAFKSILYVLLGILILFLSVQIIEAIFGVDLEKITTNTENDNTDIQNIEPGLDSAPIIKGLVQIIQYILGFIGLAAIAAIVIAGIMMIISFGNEDQVNKGKSIIIYAIVAVIISLSLWTIIDFFLSVFPV